MFCLLEGIIGRVRERLFGGAEGGFGQARVLPGLYGHSHKGRHDHLEGSAFTLKRIGCGAKSTRTFVSSNCRLFFMVA